MTISTADSSAQARPGGSAAAPYWRMWRSVPRELLFLLPTLPISIVGFTATIALFSTGTGTLAVFFIGVLVIIGALYVARGFGTFELARLEWAGRPRIERPTWPDGGGGGFWKWLWSVLGNAHYWLYLLHTMVVNFAVSTVTWVITVTWVSVTIGGVGYWFWTSFTPVTINDGGLSEWLLGGGDGAGSSANLALLDNLLYFVLGLAALATLPLVTRGLVLLHDVIARGTLGAFASDTLRRQVGDLEASRGAAVSAEGHSLRRLERDIHDGPQQRLVRLQMDLAAADRQLDKDPAKARQLIAEAMQQSRDALEELRALSRGFAPPILLDRGLVAALESTAVRSSIPVRVESELPADFDLPQEIERNAYFVASEAIANAAKHSGASEVETRVALRRVPETDDTWLSVTVTDNGRGGAVAVPGHGIAGLEERLRGLGGTLEIDSPAGGPTVVRGNLPLTTSFGGSVSSSGNPAHTLGQ